MEEGTGSTPEQKEPHVVGPHGPGGGPLDAAPDIWAEIANRARAAERLAVERQIEFIQFLSSRLAEWHQRTNALAHAMWEASGKPQGQAFDNWLKAEEEVWGPLRQRIQETAYSIWQTAGKQQGKALEDWLQAEQAIVVALFERTREIAESMWKASGQPVGRSLEFWFSAEKNVLDSLSGAGTSPIDHTDRSPKQEP